MIATDDIRYLGEEGADDDDDDDTPDLPLQGPPEMKIPKSMQHLDLSQYRLLNEMLKGASDDREGWREGFMFGAVHEGTPTDPKQPSCCAYALTGLPSPCLGSLPRNEIFDELKQDVNKEVKQRRDLSFPVAETVTQRNFLYLSSIGCMFWSCVARFR